MQKLNVKHLVVGFATSIALTSNLYAGDSIENLIDSLMKLRSDVEMTQSQIDEEKEGFKAKMKSLAMQKSDLEAQINRQDTQLKKIDSELAKVQEVVAQKSEGTKGLKPLLVEAIDNLKSLTQKAIPFHTYERVAELDKIKKDLLDKLQTPEQILARVWSSYDDFLRMTRENGLFKQTIVLEGKDKLAEIVKLGTVSLYFKTPAGEYGYAKREDGEYRYVRELDETRALAIANLFDSMKKQIRTGYFEIPNAIVSMKDVK